MNALNSLILIIISIVFMVFLSFVLSWPVMWLWNNALIGAVNGVNEVTWLQAWGINILAGLLFQKTDRSSK